MNAEILRAYDITGEGGVLCASRALTVLALSTKLQR